MHHHGDPLCASVQLLNAGGDWSLSLEPPPSNIFNGDSSSTPSLYYHHHHCCWYCPNGSLSQPAAFNNELCSLSGSVLPPETCFNKCFISKDLWKDFITVIKLRQNTNDDDDDDDEHWGLRANEVVTSVIENIDAPRLPTFMNFQQWSSSSPSW